ncbi:hypothetical protein HF086_005427 [Spodoptera exigua]|uniref:HAT C-terminal dimerisation domain-containing protein n=1 Tax=Spodoptera exigua TaxID=7107 RepID=A0A922MC49_SPOEX|nr:hypothetical protein HF086_005427 [Spodoptera exigua]
MSESVTACAGAGQHAVSESVTSCAGAGQHAVLDSGLPLSTVWVRVERARAAVHWRAPEAGAALPEDPQRLPLAADVAHLLQPAGAAAPLLLVQALRLAKVPLMPLGQYVLSAADASGDALGDASEAEGAEALLALVRAARRLPATSAARGAGAAALVAALVEPPEYLSGAGGFLRWLRALWGAACEWAAPEWRDALLCWRLRWLHALLLLLDLQQDWSRIRKYVRVRRKGECFAQWCFEEIVAYGGGSWTVWGGISASGKTQLEVVTGPRLPTLNAQRYIRECLKPHVIRYADYISPNFLYIESTCGWHRQLISSGCEHHSYGRASQKPRQASISFQRDFYKANYEILNTYLLNNLILNDGNTNELWLNFKKQIHSTIESFIPEKRKYKNKRFHKPWINKEILDLTVHKKELWRIYRIGRGGAQRGAPHPQRGALRRAALGAVRAALRAAGAPGAGSGRAARRAPPALAALRAAAADPALPPHHRLYVARVAGEVCEEACVAQWGAACAALGRALPPDAELAAPPPRDLLVAALAVADARCAQLERGAGEASEAADPPVLGALLPAPAEWAAARVALCPAPRRAALLAALLGAAPAAPPAARATGSRRAARCWRRRRRRGRRPPRRAAWRRCSRTTPSSRWIARQYWSCPPGSVASEQLFSGAGLLYSPLRNRLGGDEASKLLEPRAAAWPPQLAGRAARVAARLARGGAGGALLATARLEAEARGPAARAGAALLEALEQFPQHKWVCVRGAACWAAQAAALPDLMLERALRLHALPEELARPDAARDPSQAP